MIEKGTLNSKEEKWCCLYRSIARHNEHNPFRYANTGYAKYFLPGEFCRKTIGLFLIYTKKVLDAKDETLSSLRNEK